MITVSTQINTAVVRVLNKKLKIVSWIFAIVFGIAAAVFGTMYVLYDDYPITYLVVSTALCAFFGILVNGMYKAEKDCKTTINIYEFDETFFTVSSSRNNEIIGTSKIYYADLKLAKLLPAYLFLYLPTNQAYPVSLDVLTQEELQQIIDCVAAAGKKIKK